jgi:GNAT superfamily N-acetyltransferase
VEDLPKYIISCLDKKHDRSSFSCGIDALDAYLKTQASQDVKKNVAITYVLTQKNSEKIIGFYTISSIGIFLEDLPFEIAKKLPRYPVIPGILLGRLAVDHLYHGQKIGAHLLIDAMKRSLQLAQQIGIVAMIVEAKNETAIDFYSHFGFVQFPQDKQRLFLPMNTLKKLNL